LESAALLILPFVATSSGMMINGVLYFVGSAIGSARILALAMEACDCFKTFTLFKRFDYLNGWNSDEVEAHFRRPAGSAFG
jgi:hypothetical protein